uniref:DUF4476 domain-containing protein n=1 Tax=Parastrongyloides trichosuri TaxID=131310 RepID=A0A0N5A1S8_PARTI
MNDDKSVADEDSNLSSNDLECSEDPEVVMEKLEEADTVPGLFDYIKKHEIEVDKVLKASRNNAELDQRDIRLINDLSSLTTDDLMEFIVNIQNRSFTLAKEEATQYARGRILGILNSGKINNESMIDEMKNGANIY